MKIPGINSRRSQNVNLPSDEHDERVGPKNHWRSPEEYCLFLRHRAAYFWAIAFARQKRVLEVGCGEGYGADILGRDCQSLIALDHSNHTVGETRSRCHHEHVSFLSADATHLPFQSGSFDLCLAFQVIEHIKQVDSFLAEARRVLTGGGQLLITTPNKRLRLLPFQRPWNLHHVREYSKRDLGRLLGRHFDRVELLGLHGTPEMHALETRRVKKGSPRQLVKSSLPRPIFMRLRSFHKRRQPQPSFSYTTLELEKRFSENDFRVESEEAENAIDLLAVCGVSK